MNDDTCITIAVKCPPEESKLDKVAEASLGAVELYTNDYRIHCVDRIVQTCKKYPFRYAIYALTQGYEPDLLAELANNIKAEIVTFNDIYWNDK